jgi:hypothetical protein
MDAEPSSLELRVRHKNGGAFCGRVTVMDVMAESRVESRRVLGLNGAAFEIPEVPSTTVRNREPGVLNGIGYGLIELRLTEDCGVQYTALIDATAMRSFDIVLP